MKNLNHYITEKFIINNNTKINHIDVSNVKIGWSIEAVFSASGVSEINKYLDSLLKYRSEYKGNKKLLTKLYNKRSKNWTIASKLIISIYLQLDFDIIDYLQNGLINDNVKKITHEQILAYFYELYVNDRNILTICSLYRYNIKDFKESVKRYLDHYHVQLPK